MRPLADPLYTVPDDAEARRRHEWARLPKLFVQYPRRLRRDSNPPTLNRDGDIFTGICYAVGPVERSETLYRIFHDMFSGSHDLKRRLPETRTAHCALADPPPGALGL